MMKHPARQRRRCPAVVAAAATLTLALAACTSDPGSDETAGTSAVQAGGTLRVGVLGSPTDTLDPAQATTPLSHSVVFNVFDSIVLLQDGEFVNQLAESITPNEDATEWTITLRDSVNFHDGSELTADDALYSLEHISQSPNYAAMWTGANWEASSSDGDRTVTVVFDEPKASFVEEALARGSAVFPEGYTREDFADPVGSGPFTVESFSSDTGAVLVRNENYWAETALLEQIELLPMPDPAARVTALESGQIDYASGITATGAETLRGNNSMTAHNYGIENSDVFFFTMNATVAPFDDPEVREAFKQLVDREQLVDTVMRGEGEIGNDVVGMGLPGYNEALPEREHDAEAAEVVLADKGVTEVEILASETAPGILDATKMLQQQLAEAGITLTINEADPANLYHDMEGIYSAQMFANYYVNVPVASTLSIMTGSGAPFNYSQWSTPEYDHLLAESNAIVDPDERQAHLNEMQKLLWSEGGEIQWGYLPALAGSVSGVDGVSMSQNVPLFGQAGFTE